jgi:hypothetical protein
MAPIHPLHAPLLLLLLPFLAASNPVNYRWPDPKNDYLEALLYQQQGHRANNFAQLLLPDGCAGAFSSVNGRNVGAEWLRIAYHDMATADVAAGRGGLDASIVFETQRPENVGNAFPGAFEDLFRGQRGATSSLADIIAAAAVIAVGSCSRGQLVIPFRGGRVEAAGPEPSGVPEPHQSLEEHTAAFRRQGFNVTEMIGLVACGHTIGGVHGRDFPTIVTDDPDVVSLLLWKGPGKSGGLLTRE